MNILSALRRKEYDCMKVTYGNVPISIVPLGDTFYYNHIPMKLIGVPDGESEYYVAVGKLKPYQLYWFDKQNVFTMGQFSTRLEPLTESIDYFSL